MKTIRSIRIIAVSYFLGIASANALALFVWAKDATVSGFDFGTALLCMGLSLTWPVQVFADFMASSSLIRKVANIAFVVVLIALGYYIERSIHNRHVLQK